MVVWKNVSGLYYQQYPPVCINFEADQKRKFVSRNAICELSHNKCLEDHRYNKVRLLHRWFSVTPGCCQLVNWKTISRATGVEKTVESPCTCVLRQDCASHNLEVLNWKSVIFEYQYRNCQLSWVESKFVTKLQQRRNCWTGIFMLSDSLSLQTEPSLVPERCFVTNSFQNKYFYFRFEVHLVRGTFLCTTVPLLQGYSWWRCHLERRQDMNKKSFISSNN